MAWELKTTVAPAFPRDAFVRRDWEAVDRVWGAWLDHHVNTAAKGFAERGVAPTAPAPLEMAVITVGAVRAAREWQREIAALHGDKLADLAKRVKRLEAKVRRLEKDSKNDD